MGEVMYLADPTSPIPSHCAVIILLPSASIAVTSTLRVKVATITHRKFHGCLWNFESPPPKHLPWVWTLSDWMVLWSYFWWTFVCVSWVSVVSLLTVHNAICLCSSMEVLCIDSMHMFVCMFQVIKCDKRPKPKQIIWSLLSEREAWENPHPQEVSNTCHNKLVWFCQGWMHSVVESLLVRHPLTNCILVAIHSSKFVPHFCLFLGICVWK